MMTYDEPVTFCHRCGLFNDEAKNVKRNNIMDATIPTSAWKCIFSPLQIAIFSCRKPKQVHQPPLKIPFQPPLQMVYVVVRGLVLIRIPGCFAFVFRVGLYLDQVCFLHVSCDVIYRSNSEAIMCVLVVMFHMGDSPTKRVSFKARSKKISSAEI